MSYFFEFDDLFIRSFAGDKSNYSASRVSYITVSQFQESVKNQLVESIDIFKVYDNFGIVYAVRVHLIDQTNMSNIRLLAATNNQALYYESMDNVLKALQDFGYELPKVGLKTVDVFLEF